MYEIFTSASVFIFRSSAVSLVRCQIWSRRISSLVVGQSLYCVCSSTTGSARGIGGHGNCQSPRLLFRVLRPVTSVDQYLTLEYRRWLDCLQNLLSPAQNRC